MFDFVKFCQAISIKVIEIDVYILSESCELSPDFFRKRATVISESTVKIISSMFDPSLGWGA